MNKNAKFLICTILGIWGIVYGDSGRNGELIPEPREMKLIPLLISEIGAEAIPGIYGGQRWSEEYQADLLETVVRHVLDSDRYSGVFLWQFCDTRTYISNMSQVRAGGFNFKGILDRYRNPKISWRRLSEMIKTNTK